MYNKYTHASDWALIPTFLLDLQGRLSRLKWMLPTLGDSVSEKGGGLLLTGYSVDRTGGSIGVFLLILVALPAAASTSSCDGKVNTLEVAGRWSAHAIKKDGAVLGFIGLSLSQIEKASGSYQPGACAGLQSLLYVALNTDGGTRLWFKQAEPVVGSQPFEST